MKRKNKCKNVGFSTILCAVTAILFFALPSNAQEPPLEITGEVTVPSFEYPGPIGDGGNVLVTPNSTLNLIVEEGIIGTVNGYIGIQETGTLNLEGGYVSFDVVATNGSEVNIKGGDVGGFILDGITYWDIIVKPTAKVTVFGTIANFFVTNGTIITDSSGTYFTANTSVPANCTLTGSYGENAGDINLIFRVESNATRIYLAESGSSSPEQLLEQLIVEVEILNLNKGIDNSLDSKLQNVLDALEATNAGQRQDAVNKMNAFISAVEAQRDKAITSGQADHLIGLAQGIIDML